MKYLSFLMALLLFNYSYGQDIPNIKVLYSKTDNGSVGKDEKTFYMKNGYMYEIDEYYGTNTSYGKLVFENSTYEDGLYYEYFIPDKLTMINSSEMYVYKIFYNEKGGDVLYIIEAKSKFQRVSYIKYFFTEKGYNKQYGKSNNNNEYRENQFDIENVILTSNNLSQIMSKINFSFEQSSDKKLSKDGMYVTVEYSNNSLVHPFITYSKEGTVVQIVFILPLSNTLDIYNKLNKIYKEKLINGIHYIQKGELLFDIRYEDELGFITIK